MEEILDTVNRWFCFLEFVLIPTAPGSSISVCLPSDLIIDRKSSESLCCRASTNHFWWQLLTMVVHYVESN